MAAPILTREDLLNFTKIYSILKGTDEITEIQVIDQLKQQCGATGVSKRDFDKLVKLVKQKIEEEQKPVATVDTEVLPDVITNTGPDYIISEDGIYLISGKMQIEVCPHPIFPVQILKDIETGEEKMRIAFKRKGKWNTDIIVNRYDIATNRGIVKLANYGVLVNDTNAGYLVKFFCDIEKLNEDKLKQTYATSSLGFSDYGFIPYSSDVIYNQSNQDNNRRFNLYKQHGSYDKWRDMQIRIMDHTIPKIIIAASYASLLIEQIGINPFGVHLWGETGLGKSVALLSGASIYGYPDIKNGIVYTGNATANGLEPRLAFVKNCAFYLDELSMLSQKQIDDMIYLIMQGQGKARMTRAGNSRGTYYWNLVSISNSEMPITNDLSKGGTFNRIVQIGANEKVFGDMSLPEVANTFKENYGFGAKPFIELIGRDDIKQEIAQLKKQYYDKLIGVTEDKQANAGSVLLAAFDIVARYIYSTDKRLTVDEVKQYMTTPDEISQVLRAYNKLVDWTNANYKMFDNSAMYGNASKWGNETITNDGEELLNILPYKFSEFCTTVNINEKQFLLGLKQHKLIKYSVGFRNVVRFNDKSTKVISLLKKHFNVTTQVVTSCQKMVEIDENLLDELPF